MVRALRDRILARMPPGVGELIVDAEHGPFPPEEKISAAEVIPDWKTTGASAFTEQLDRIGEANRVLQLAWEAGMFEDCIIKEMGLFQAVVKREGGCLDDSVALVEARAYEVLAEQYPDLKVRVRKPNKWESRAEQKCWVKVLAGGGRL
jgi:hypothetical protein